MKEPTKRAMTGGESPANGNAAAVPKNAQMIAMPIVMIVFIASGVKRFLSDNDHDNRAE